MRIQDEGKMELENPTIQLENSGENLTSWMDQIEDKISVFKDKKGN